MLRRSVSNPVLRVDPGTGRPTDVLFVDPHCPLAQQTAESVPQLLCLTLHGSIAAADAHARTPLPIPGGVQVAVALGGRVVYAGAFGFANAATGAPLTLGHRMKIASQSKVFTTLLALRLCEARIGGLSLDGPVWSMLNGAGSKGRDGSKGWRLPPDRCGPVEDPRRWATQAEGITLRHLLSHTSGLGVRGFPQRPLRGACGTPTARAMMEGCFGESSAPRLEQEPGGSGSVLYSGAGFTLIQMLIEHATGRSFADAAEQYLLRPAGLSHTTFRPGGDANGTGINWIGLRRSLGLHGHDPYGQPLPHTYYPACASSGAYSNAMDLAAVFSAVARDAHEPRAIGDRPSPADRAAAHNRLSESQSREPGTLPRLLSPGLAAEALTPISAHTNGLAFGLGFALSPWAHGTECMRIHKHAGWGPGFWCTTEGFVELNAAVSVQCNMEEPRGRQVAQSILSALMGRMWSERSTLGAPSCVLAGNGRV